MIHILGKYLTVPVFLVGFGILLIFDVIVPPVSHVNLVAAASMECADLALIFVVAPIAYRPATKNLNVILAGVHNGRPSRSVL